MTTMFCIARELTLMSIMLAAVARKLSEALSGNLRTADRPRFKAEIYFLAFNTRIAI